MSDNFTGFTTSGNFENGLQGDKPEATKTTTTPVQQKSRRTFYVVFGIVLFFVFIIFKLPEAKIQNLIIAHIKIQAQNQGLSFNAEKIKLGMIFGPALKMYNVEVKSLEDDKVALVIPFIKVKPVISSLPFQRKKVSVKIELTNGSISGTLGLSPTSTLIDLSLSKINLSQLSILKKFIFIELNGLINGKIGLDLSFDKPDQSDGQINLEISNLGTTNQSLFGMQLPDLKVSQSIINISLDKGRFTFKDVHFGKDINKDDLLGALNGDVTLASSIERSMINAKIQFQLSSKVRDKIPLLESLLSSAKTADGKFSYKLVGNLSTLEPQPGG